MRWKVRYPGTKTKAKKRWHRWFAWHPVRCPSRGNVMVWLETVQRKGEIKGTGPYGTGEWHYKYR